MGHGIGLHGNFQYQNRSFFLLPLLLLFIFLNFQSWEPFGYGHILLFKHCTRAVSLMFFFFFPILPLYTDPHQTI